MKDLRVGTEDSWIRSG